MRKPPIVVATKRKFPRETSEAVLATFTAEGRDFLGRMSSMTPSQFKEQRSAYQALIADPAKTFVTALVPRLQESISSGIEGEPKTNGSIAPINNDRRFAPDKPPYKDHLLFRFWEGPNKKTAPTLFVRVAADSVGFASGMMFADVATWRETIDADGDGLASAIATPSAGRSTEVVGEVLKRTPAPYTDDHPHAALLRHKMFQIRWLATDIDITADAFVEQAAAELSGAAAVHRWLGAL